MPRVPLLRCPAPARAGAGGSRLDVTFLVGNLFVGWLVSNAHAQTLPSPWVRVR